MGRGKGKGEAAAAVRRRAIKVVPGVPPPTTEPEKVDWRPLKEVTAANLTLSYQSYPFLQFCLSETHARNVAAAAGIGGGLSAGNAGVATVTPSGLFILLFECCAGATPCTV